MTESWILPFLTPLIINFLKLLHLWSGVMMIVVEFSFI